MDFKKCQTCCHDLKTPSKVEKLTVVLFDGKDTHCFVRKKSRDYQREKTSTFLKNFLRQSKSRTSEPEPKRAKLTSFMALVDSSLVDTVNQMFISFLISYTFNLQ